VHPSPFAFYLLIMLPLAGVLCFNSRSSLGRVGAGVLCLAVVVCIIATFTRIAWLGLLITLFVVAAQRSRLSLVCLPVVVLVAVLLVPGMNERLFGEENLDTGDTRVNLWSEALSYTSIAQLPAGLGLGAVEKLAGIAAHNDYVRLWIETGLLGVAAVGWLYVSTLRFSLRAARSPLSSYERQLAVGFAAVLVARLAMMVTDNLMVHPVLEWYFWAFAALIVAIQVSHEAPPRRRPFAASALHSGLSYSDGARRAR